MINQEKVCLMTRAERYRQREKRGALEINRYSRWSYVSTKVMKSLIFCTVATVIVVVLWGIYNAEQLLSIYDMEEIMDLAGRLLVVYGAVMLAALAVSWRTYSRRYTDARSSVKKYYVILKKINDHHEKSRNRLAGRKEPARKEGGRR